MKWIVRNHGAFSAPYAAYRDSRGHWAVWLNARRKFGILARELPTLASAQKYAEEHATREKLKEQTPGLVGPHGQESA
jgi:hypothetical protein